MTRAAATTTSTAPSTRRSTRRSARRCSARTFIPLHGGDDYRLFEGCLPIEELAARGEDTMRFGPLKPKGLTDPRTGRWPYAAVQLRWEDTLQSAVSLVGFQTRLRFGEQERVFRLIPGLSSARFLRYGRMHRNSYLDAPRVLAADAAAAAAPARADRRAADGARRLHVGHRHRAVGGGQRRARCAAEPR